MSRIAFAAASEYLSNIDQLRVRPRLASSFLQRLLAEMTCSGIPWILACVVAPLSRDDVTRG